jgi:energy-coupling factor transporter ATP-binding protein EcfA2
MLPWMKKSSARSDARSDSGAVRVEPMLAALPTETGGAAPSAMSALFEHSITWEDDLWRADPCDVDTVHEKARRKFLDLLLEISNGKPKHARMLLFLGQSGAGKTHLIRALRTYAHHYGLGYVGYAQMSSEVTSYADFFLRRLVNSLEKSYDPFQRGESGLRRLADHMVGDAELVGEDDLADLREAPLDDAGLARLVVRLADSIVASPRFADQELDINIVRALLYMQRNDPRIDGRIRQYLYGRPLNELSRGAVAALDANAGEDRPFEIIESLGRLMWTVDNAALVFCIDQVEDLRSLGEPEERFERAVRDLVQITNRVPTAITIISSLEDFYRSVRERLPRSFIDRIEKAGAVQLSEARTAEEARLIIEKRLAHAAESEDGVPLADVTQLFGPDFFAELRGLSPRRLLEAVQLRLSGNLDGAGGLPAEALGGDATEAGADEAAISVKDRWDHFNLEFAVDVPVDEAELIAILIQALQTCQDESGGAVRVTLQPGNWGDVHGADLFVQHASGTTYENRLFICNRGSQGGALKRQLDRITQLSKGKNPIVIRASDFPPNAKSGTGQSLRLFQQAGGRRIVVSLNEWERMIALNEFRVRYRQEPGFSSWLAGAKPLSHLTAVSELLRLDLFGPLKPANGPLVADEAEAAPVHLNGGLLAGADAPAMGEASLVEDYEERPAIDVGPVPELADEPDDLMLGRELSVGHNTVTLTKDILKRHAAVLGGSGSGKTTLAISIIEQLLLKGIPAVLIDRKGDLCSYANPDVWRSIHGEEPERRDLREALASNIDVAVYTPGRTSGRPISITLLPTGIAELPEHEQQLLANVSAAALGDMLHLKNSATHQRQGGILAVALKILGATSLSEVTLPDLIYLLENEDPALTDLTQRMDPSGKIRRDLVGQLDSLRHRNWALFEGGGEPLRMESLLGLGPFARRERTRLSIIYTGFLGDNENILFWIAQFLSEALRFSQRNPNEELQAVIMFDEADLYIPANSKPATKEPLESLLKRARSAGIGLLLATQSPGDLDYKSRDQITSWFIGKVREDTALRKLRAAFSAMSGLDPAQVLPHQSVGEFHLIQEGLVLPMKSKRSLIAADQVPFDRIEQLAAETKGQDAEQLKLAL